MKIFKSTIVIDNQFILFLRGAYLEKVLFSISILLLIGSLLLSQFIICQVHRWGLQNGSSLVSAGVRKEEKSVLEVVSGGVTFHCAM